MSTGDGAEAAASVFRLDADCGKDSAGVAPAVVSELVTASLDHGPSVGAGGPRAVAVVESPVSPAVKACSCSRLHLLVVAALESEAVVLWFDLKPSASSAGRRDALQASVSACTCWVVRSGSEVEVMLLVTGAETLKDLGENNPEIPQNKTSQLLKLQRNIVPKYLQAQIEPQLHFSTSYSQI